MNHHSGPGGHQGHAGAAHQSAAGVLGQSGGAGVVGQQVVAGPPVQLGAPVQGSQQLGGPVQHLVQSTEERWRLSLRDSVLSTDIPLLMSMHGNILLQVNALVKTDVNTGRVLRQYCDIQEVVHMQAAGMNWNGFLDRMLEDTIASLLKELGRVRQLLVEQI